jgi:uncharacterized iron-regulated protein
MTLYSHRLTIVACLLFSGCTSLPADPTQVQPPQTQYETVVTGADGTPLSINQLAKGLATADVVVIGEYHGHHGAHLLQSRLQVALHLQRPSQVLTMEQFTLEDQAELDSYLAGQSGEEELIADTSAWSNYRASYRPLIEYAKDQNLPVIAANAPEGIVRCVGRNGEAYLQKLEKDERRQLPESPFADISGYRKKFVNSMGNGHGETGNSNRLDNRYKAQLLRDNTMADRVIKALESYPGHQVIHLTGTFHAESRLGMVGVLERRRPNLEVAVVSPVFWQQGDLLNSLVQAHKGKGDFLYFLQPLPAKYTDSERQRDAMIAQFREASARSCP